MHNGLGNCRHLGRYFEQQAGDFCLIFKLFHFCRHYHSFPPRVKGTCDNCLIVGVSRDALKPKDEPRKIPDVLCPLEPEYYKKGVERVCNLLIYLRLVSNLVLAIAKSHSADRTTEAWVEVYNHSNLTTTSR